MIKAHRFNIPTSIDFLYNAYDDIKNCNTFLFQLQLINLMIGCCNANNDSELNPHRN